MARGKRWVLAWWKGISSQEESHGTMRGEAWKVARYGNMRKSPSCPHNTRAVIERLPAELGPLWTTTDMHHCHAPSRGTPCHHDSFFPVCSCSQYMVPIDDDGSDNSSRGKCPVSCRPLSEVMETLAMVYQPSSSAYWIFRLRPQRKKLRSNLHGGLRSDLRLNADSASERSAANRFTVMQ